MGRKGYDPAFFGQSGGTTAPGLEEHAPVADYMLMPVPRTLTEALNAHPATIEVVGLYQTSSTVRPVPYKEIYRESTSVRETPVERMQRIADADVGVADS
jgi:hypothetical protein